VPGWQLSMVQYNTVEYFRECGGRCATFCPEFFCGLIQHAKWFGLPKNIGKPVKEELFGLGFYLHHPKKCNDASPEPAPLTEETSTGGEIGWSHRIPDVMIDCFEGISFLTTAEVAPKRR